MELGPRNHRADVHEAAEIEQHVDARVHFVVAALRLLEKLAAPVEGAAGDGTGEEVVGAEAACCTKEEETEGDGEEDVGFAVDPAALQGEFDTPAGCEANEAAIYSRHDDIVEPRL